MGREVKEATNIIGASHEAEERREEREAPAHLLKQVIEEQRHSNVERVRDEVNGVIYNKPAAANDDLGGYCRQKVKQVNDTDNPDPGTRGRFNPFHHFVAPNGGTLQVMLYH